MRRFFRGAMMPGEGAMRVSTARLWDRIAYWGKKRHRQVMRELAQVDDKDEMKGI